MLFQAGAVIKFSKIPAVKLYQIPCFFSFFFFLWGTIYIRFLPLSLFFRLFFTHKDIKFNQWTRIVYRISPALRPCSPIPPCFIQARTLSATSISLWLPLKLLDVVFVVVETMSDGNVCCCWPVSLFYICTIAMRKYDSSRLDSRASPILWPANLSDIWRGGLFPF